MEFNIKLLSSVNCQMWKAHLSKDPRMDSLSVAKHEKRYELRFKIWASGLERNALGYSYVPNKGKRTNSLFGIPHFRVSNVLSGVGLDLRSRAHD